MFPKTRRRFLQELTAGSGLLLGASGWYSAPPFAAEGTDRKADSPSADKLIPGKDPRLIVHNASPCEIETPGGLLLENRLTPTSLLFVRNNQQPDGSVTLAPSPNSEDWPIEFGGLIEAPRPVRWGELRGLPMLEREVVLQCSGNGRKQFSSAVFCPGSQWDIGAVANVRFGGIPLQAVLQHLKTVIDPRARFLTAEGKDAPSKPDGFDFEHSVPLEDALRFGLLAVTMNGQPLPSVHGGPVRLVMPGYYGTMHVKWVSRLRFEAGETANHHQVKRYRTPNEPIEPGAPFDYNLQNSEPNWRMKVKSLVYAPGDGAEIPAGPVRLRGVASMTAGPG